ncbi:ribosomal protein S12 methylthiotransferase RimO [Striga asiatica]|uniref:Ribosomal protein S12 methylthiotransferase RimO n=1 Tax=Striga asiatica TaxID=4170 RepID=A0A5A7QFX0_STRAF|nr:ribosomal protein S12 methylthiotransferase RimO [Striga asiatica]
MQPLNAHIEQDDRDPFFKKRNRITINFSYTQYEFLQANLPAMHISLNSILGRVGPIERHDLDKMQVFVASFWERKARMLCNKGCGSSEILPSPELGQDFSLCAD